MDGGEGAGAGTLLGLRGPAAVAAFGAGEDAAGGDDEDVSVGEFFFEFAGEAVWVDVLVGGEALWKWEGDGLPLLRAMPARESWDGDEDDDGLPAVADLDLQEESWCQRACCPVPTASSGCVSIGR